MATSFLRLNILSCFLLVSLCLLIYSKQTYAFQEKEITHSHTTVLISSLLPSSVCNTSTKASERKSSLKVVHKHGPCNKVDGDITDSLSLQADQILLKDQARVNSIHSRLSKKTVSSKIKQTEATTIPAKDGAVVDDSGDYIVTVGLGNPKKQYLSLLFDTGSDITWTQCKPCANSCYEQKEPIFDPSKSKTYANVSCSSEECKSLESATGFSMDCPDSTCVYGIQYADSSYSFGFFARETLTLTSSDVFPNFLFGCGQNNGGLFGKSAGLLGLGRNQLSIVSQTDGKYKRFFSYCLPSSSSSTGHLTFGQPDNLSKTLQFTPLSAVFADTSFYGLDIVGISVGGQKLPIPKSVFSNTGTIIDSGTVITRLPPAAYSALRTAFRKAMTKYPRAPDLSFLDTCYNLSNYTSVKVPKIGFFFRGGIEVIIDVSGIFYVNKVSQVCLALVGNTDANDAAIFGSVQQKTLEVVYDIPGRRVGFAPKGCS
ncbi:Aspartyl protease family protein [Melia azedarach]|uniref:Aspartyl protease family protein n=1 Tax=Melia azedarach TaxID=155640 RepID=A0ACC1WU16_MELAZ|nr:Aspartyl protease family protein [Melia azedarach]